MDSVISFIKVLVSVAPGVIDAIEEAIHIWSKDNGVDPQVLIRHIREDGHRVVDAEVDQEIEKAYKE